MRKFMPPVAAASLVLSAGLLSTGLALSVQQAEAASAVYPPQRDYSFSGFFGSFDRGELQRGLQVYGEVCASCHGMDLIRYRDLRGIGYSDEQIKAFAAEFELVKGPNEDGEMFDAPALPSDSFVNPYANVEEAAAVNGGKAPPDLSLIVKARAHGLGSIGANFIDMLRGGEFATGSTYVAELFASGYVEEPGTGEKSLCMPKAATESEEEYQTRLNEWELPDGTYFNKWFPGCAIAMPAGLLYEDAVEYTDGTPATIEQQAHDVSVFLSWASEPYMEQRKQTGIMVLSFLLVFTALLYMVKRQVWTAVKK